jgi:hypothetical protein
MNVEHLQLVRRVVLEATGGADTITLTLESGTPYRHLNMWVRARGPGTIDVTAQPLFGGVNDGSSTAVGDSNPTKVFQITIEEVRPATRLLKHPNDDVAAESLKSELQLTNNAAADVEISIYIMAMATPGGA